MNQDSAKHVQIAHPLGLRMPFGPSFGFCSLPPHAQALQKGNLPPFLLDNSLQPNIIVRKENFVNIPNFPRLSKEDSQSVPSTASWAEGEEAQLFDSLQVAKTVEKSDQMKIKSPQDFEEFCAVKQIDYNYLKASNGHEELMKALGSGLSQHSKKISKTPVNLASYVEKKSRTGINYSNATLKEYNERQSNKHRNKRNPWKPTEDAKLLELVSTYGECWAMISSKMTDRTGKQIRDRYLNILRPNLKKGEWTQPEDALLVNLYYQIGHKWSLIAKYMPGRSEAQVKNRFYSHIKKRLQEKPSEFNLPSFAQEFMKKALEHNEMEEEEDESGDEDNSIADHLSENIKNEENEKKNVKVEFSQCESESEYVKKENEEEMNHASFQQKMPAKLWDHFEAKKLEMQKRFLQQQEGRFMNNSNGEYTREYKEAMGHYMPNPDTVRTNPINEKEVDMVLEILARYYQEGKQLSYQEQLQRKLMLQQREVKPDEDKFDRLRQLDTRKAQLEFLLGQTMREMDSIHKKK